MTGKLLKTTTRLAARAAMMMRIKSTTAILETVFEIVSTILGAFAVNSMPRPTGTAVRRNILMPRAVTLTSGPSAPMKCLTERAASRGTVTMESRLVTAVREIERGVLPLASRVRTFDVTPPGQKERIITLTASSAEIDLGIHMNGIMLGIIVTFSWWGVNNLEVGLHSYGFTEGVMPALYKSWGIMGIFILMGIWLFIDERGKKAAKKAEREAKKVETQPDRSSPCFRASFKPRFK